ncbi:MAG TPA: hypothetical protein VD866_07040 [Urbifossiella sp.]|nr:hypothetical protein [Urbifossiella sp.]
MTTKNTPTWKRVVVAALAVAATVGGVVWSARAGGGRDLPVKGRVTVDGAPLAGGLVIFYPDASRGNESPVEPRGRTNRRGEYQLRAEGQAGIAPGWYRVAVVPRQPDPGEPAASKSKTQVGFDRRYERPNTSGLAVLVSRDAEGGSYDLRIGRPRVGK